MGNNTDLQSHALHTPAEPPHSLHHHYIITLLDMMQEHTGYFQLLGAADNVLQHHGLWAMIQICNLMHSTQFLHHYITILAVTIYLN